MTIPTTMNRWSKQEIDTLLNSLRDLGRDRRKLAARIETKTPLEVEIFLQELEKAARRHKAAVPVEDVPTSPTPAVTIDDSSFQTTHPTPTETAQTTNNVAKDDDTESIDEDAPLPIPESIINKTTNAKLDLFNIPNCLSFCHHRLGIKDPHIPPDQFLQHHDYLRSWLKRIIHATAIIAADAPKPRHQIGALRTDVLRAVAWISPEFLLLEEQPEDLEHDLNDPNVVDHRTVEYRETRKRRRLEFQETQPPVEVWELRRQVANIKSEEYIQESDAEADSEIET
ncbi:hypothetical protein HK097_006948 [Rhizophlyctis rosea]|uniref:Uncharacterized protein n=1 Tax=Rhizophlyctis rosea TaxID=64517 RepID=A0AAD5X1Y3_9FUNG|nr:hypothetical protein HK097_006948 [Rhizophlyctis rosea]